MLRSLLIANRGEIACRIIRTARRLGVHTVAVFSDADRTAPHVRLADDAVFIGPAPAVESYLDADKLLSAAGHAGAQAIHPGYGFLSENAAFAQAVLDAGLLWVGPKPASIQAMGLKDAAKALMADAGVPVTPGYLGAQQDAAHLAEQAGAIGYPVLIKAVAGGGGKGMRKVAGPDAFDDALASCRREAAAAFGNDVVLLEKWIENPRHIEVQVFGDSHGNVVHLFERDCSLQRRHQKVVEEAPAPGMSEATRRAVCDAAVRAARAVAYEGAGTVEFIADGRGALAAERVWFMEMNTRLQVEHPVTEAITGVDLVEWQLRVASGEPLPLTQDALTIDGHAMEARVYAENPAKRFLPSTGTLERLHFGGAGQCRVDSGVAEGGAVTPYYDPMLAKVISHGKDREEARLRLRDALAATAIWPVKSNTSFLVNALEHPEFVAGALDTGLIDRDGDALARLPAFTAETLSRAAATLVAPGPYGGFRVNAPVQREARFLLAGEPVAVAVGDTPGEGPAEQVLVTERGHTLPLTLWRKNVDTRAGAGSGAVLAPMPGVVLAVAVEAGARVTRGQTLLVLEAMKMEHALTAPFDGVVAELATEVGERVQVEALLVRVERP